MAELLNSTNNNLVAFQYEQLLALAQEAIAAGDYNGGQLFDQTAATNLLTQGQDFASLPSVSAENRALADSLNYPLQLLQARYAAISAEASDFVTRMTGYIGALEQDADQIDRMLLAADLENWAAGLPALTGAVQFYYDLGSTHGVVSDDIPLTDPLSGKIYADANGNPIQLVPVSFAFGSTLVYGIGAPVALTDSAPLAMSWTQTAAGTADSAFGSDWATYSLVAPAPVMTYQQPQATIVLPNNLTGQVLRLQGSFNTGNLPVYVKFVFLSRQKVLPFNPTAAGQILQLTPYKIDPSVNPIVIDAAKSYEENQDYTLDYDNGNKNLIALETLAGKSLTVYCNEFYPAYQCSINNVDWSPALYLDPVNPFPDPVSTYFPVSIPLDINGNPWYPLSDELGHPVGLLFQPVGLISQEYLIRIETQGAVYGVTAVLEVDLVTPDYYNGIQLTPYADLPMRLLQITGAGRDLDENQVLFTGNLLLDRTVSIRFSNSDGSNPYLTSLFLTLYQENYTLIESVTESPASQRQQTLAQFQYFIPYAKTPVYQALPARFTGAEYDFGLKDLQAQRWDPLGNGVFVTGPFSYNAAPSLLRVDAVVNAQIDCYPVFSFYNALGGLTGTLQVLAPFHFSGPGSFCCSVSSFIGWPAIAPASVTLYLKWVFRSQYSVLTRYNIQIV